MPVLWLLHAAAGLSDLDFFAFLSSPWPLSVSSGTCNPPVASARTEDLLQKAYFSYFAFRCTIQRYSRGDRPRRVDNSTLEW